MAVVFTGSRGVTAGVGFWVTIGEKEEKEDVSATAGANEEGRVTCTRPSSSVCSLASSSSFGRPPLHRMWMGVASSCGV